MKFRDRMTKLVTDAYERGFDEGVKATVERFNKLTDEAVDSAFRAGYRSARGTEKPSLPLSETFVHEQRRRAGLQ